MAAAMWTVVVAALICFVPGQAQLAFRLANIYADQMVLQMAPKSTQIWGFGTNGTAVSVQLVSEQFNTTVGTDGKWSVRLSPRMAGGPYQLTVNHGASDVIRITVWFGDVWVCSGQSNMEMAILLTHNSTEEIAKAITYQNIRLLHVQNILSAVELDELPGISTAWSAPSNQNVPGFSALCIMYGERLSDSRGGRPIGLIDSTWGGTPIEAWSSQRILTSCNTPPSGGGGGANDDKVLWNAMIHPLTKMAVRGAIWYQGESNTGYHADYYSCHMQGLTEDWKNTFVDGRVAVPSENSVAFPFGIVQIGPYSGGGMSAYGDLRWHQSYDQGVLPNSNMIEAFMAAAYDTTDPGSPTGDIHPRDKQTVADRLANAAKSLLYSENLHRNGPIGVITASSDGTVTLNYNQDIRVQAANGFSFLRSDGSWVATTIASSSGRNVTVNVETGATFLAYAWQGVVCDYKACAIYGADSQALPAQVWLWDLRGNSTIY